MKPRSHIDEVPFRFRFKQVRYYAWGETLSIISLDNIFSNFLTLDKLSLFTVQQVNIDYLDYPTVM